MREIAEIIKKLRSEKNLTQKQLAEEIGVSKSTVAMWETGDRKPSRELLEQVADYFNVDMDYLYGRTYIRKARLFDEDGNEYVNKEHLNHFIDDETREIAQEIKDNPDIRTLFDVSRKAKPEDLRIVTNLLLDLLEKERG
jgi:transcriptional regulator with XRE-family HTH domain